MEALDNLIKDLTQGAKDTSLDRSSAPGYHMNPVLQSLTFRGIGFVPVNQDAQAAPAAAAQAHDQASDEGSDDEYRGIDDSESDSDSDSGGDAEPAKEAEMLRFLDEIHKDIKTKHMNPDFAFPSAEGLRAGVTPFPHQEHAAAVILAQDEKESRFKGLILADPPGLGKTMSALMAISAKHASTARKGPSVIIAPASCCSQWMKEIDRYFEPGQMKACQLVDSKTMPYSLLEYDVIVASYPFIAAEFRRLVRFDREMDSLEKESSKATPKKPRATLLGGVFDPDLGVRLGHYLILDEAHTIKNTCTTTYAAIADLRLSFEICVMLSGTPLDNTWLDSLALLSLLRGHAFTSEKIMHQIFTAPSSSTSSKKKTRPVPRGKYLLRISQLLDAVSLRRPASVTQGNLPPLHTEARPFSLPRADLEASNAKFAEFKKSMARNKGKGKRNGQARKHAMDAAWAALIEAQQHAYHPQLVDIMRMEKKIQLQSMGGGEASDEPEDAAEQQIAEAWRQRIMDTDLGCWSNRVIAIIDIINGHHDLHDCRDAVIVMDESVYFLDIVEMACNDNMGRNRSGDRRYEVFRYDGRRDVVERGLVIQRFIKAKAEGKLCVLLASRGTCGVGLNLQHANVLIQCGPWWKASWEEQAIGRVYRTGQTRPTYYYKLEAVDCLIDEYKKDRRDDKDETNTRIMDEITRHDHVPNGPNPPLKKRVIE